MRTHELPTFTAVFEVERKLYKIDDVVLPFPVSFFQLGVWVVSQVAIWFGLNLVVNFTAANGFLFLLPPFAIAHFCNRPVADEKRAHDWVWSQLRHLREPTALYALEATTEPEAVVVAVPIARRVTHAS